jgi:hypothetical protein
LLIVWLPGLAAACTKSGVVDPSHSETRYYGESEDASWAFNNGPCNEAMAWLAGPHLAVPTFKLCCRAHYLHTSRLGATRQGLKEAEHHGYKEAENVGGKEQETNRGESWVERGTSLSAESLDTHRPRVLEPRRPECLMLIWLYPELNTVALFKLVIIMIGKNPSIP